MQGQGLYTRSMRRSVYIETSIVSYLAARTSRDRIVASHQHLTRAWWRQRRSDFDLVVSQAVFEEASAGDPGASARRLSFIAGLRSLDVTERAVAIAQRLMQGARLPAKAALDALHVGVAAAHGVDLLLTWNCKHIANATFRPRIESICRAMDVVPPVICTPLELMER